MSAETLSMLAGAILSLIFSYIPGVKDRYERLDGTQKRLVMLGLLTSVALGAYGLACWGLGSDFGLVITCDKAGALALVRIWVIAIVANQGVFLISPRRN